MADHQVEEGLDAMSGDYEVIEQPTLCERCDKECIQDSDGLCPECAEWWWQDTDPWNKY